MTEIETIATNVKTKLDKSGPTSKSVIQRQKYIIDKWIKSLDQDQKSKVANNNLISKQAEFIKKVNELDTAYDQVIIDEGVKGSNPNHNEGL